MPDYPRYVIGSGSLAVFKFFSPDLGFALTNGCDMEAGTILTSLQGTKPVPFEYGREFDDTDWTAERVQAEHILGVRRLPIEGKTTGVLTGAPILDLSALTPKQDTALRNIAQEVL